MIEEGSVKKQRGLIGASSRTVFNYLRRGTDAVSGRPIRDMIQPCGLAELIELREEDARREADAMSELFHNCRQAQRKR